MKRPFILLVRLYQRLLSPLLPPICRYYPTCSNYSIEAIERHGVGIGVLMTMKRLMRCNPLSQGGYDPLRGGGERPASVGRGEYGGVIAHNKIGIPNRKMI